MLVDFQEIILPLSTALGLSLIVERAIEFIRNILGYVTFADNAPAVFDTKQTEQKLKELEAISNAGMYAAEAEHEAEKLSDLLEKQLLENNQSAAEATKADLKKYQRDREWNEAVPTNVVSWQSATGPSGERIYSEVAIHALGLSLGIILATIFELQLFKTFLINTGLQFPIAIDYIFTGLLISAGSGPIHVLIRFISERKVIANPEEVASTEEKEIKADSGILFSPGADSPAKEEAFKDADSIPISYEGGVDSDKLQTVHRRRNDPKYVIFHHTAMNRGSTFDDVVRVIKSRKDSKGNSWLTGYNCVITEDGGIHPFCRWDRYGSHAAGYNAKSLGIAFNGNFETGRSDPYSNYDGRYGPTVPTQAQLESGARIVALWIHLYDPMALSFGVGGCVFPHKQIAAKNCPGNMFPTQDFYDLVTYYHEKWKNSKVALEEIKKFKRKPYLYG